MYWVSQVEQGNKATQKKNPSELPLHYTSTAFPYKTATTTNRKPQKCISFDMQ